MKISKTGFFVGLLILVVIVGGVVYGAMKFFGGKSEKLSAYTAVIMDNGDIYFGKVSWFPRVKVQNAWVLQQTVDEQKKAQIGIVPVDKALWQPSKTIYLNRDKIVSWSRLKDGTDIVKGLENPESLSQNQENQGVGQGAGAPSPAGIQEVGSPEPEKPAAN